MSIHMADETFPARQRTRLRMVGKLPAQKTASDHQLCCAFLQGDASAFGELVRRHEQRVYSLVRRYTVAPEDAHDLAQRSFLKAFQAARRTLARFGEKKEVPFQAWLLRIAINLGKNHARQERRWRRAPLSFLDGENPEAPSALESLIRAESASLARESVLELPRRQREVWTLRIDAELSFAEVAAILGINENSAKVHFHYALKRLRLTLAEQVEKDRP